MGWATLTKLNDFINSDDNTVKSFALYANTLYQLFLEGKLSSEELLELLDDKYKVQHIQQEMTELKTIQDIKTIITVISALIQIAK